MQKNIWNRILSLLLIFIVGSCHGVWGDHSLGSNLSLLEGDRVEDNVIVYCSGKGVGPCKSGIYVVPTYERHYENGRYSEYIKSAKSNKDWVIVKSITIKNNEENYWLISKSFDIEKLDCGKVECDSILQSHVTGPLSLSEFLNKKKALNINIDF